jgi:predicted DNA-binding antitoxin AbrB/MazE fold protein
MVEAAGVEPSKLLCFIELQILLAHRSHGAHKTQGRGTCEEREIGDIRQPVRYSSVMTTTVDAIYEDGKLVLQQPLPLPEHARVRVTIDSDLEREAWLKLSEESLKKVWDNTADDVFNDLLKK